MRKLLRRGGNRLTLADASVDARPRRVDWLRRLLGDPGHAVGGRRHLAAGGVDGIQHLADRGVEIGQEASTAFGALQAASLAASCAARGFRLQPARRKVSSAVAMAPNSSSRAVPSTASA